MRQFPVKAIRFTRERHATSLLDACCTATGVQGGTIHQYLPRLGWWYQGNVARQGPTWHLCLDGELSIGWYAGLKRHLPTIEPGLCVGHLHSIPVDPQPL